MVCMNRISHKRFSVSRLVISLVAGVWLLLCTNPQVYFYILFAPTKIVLYMDILDVDEDIFYYYKTTDQGQDHEFVFQEEVKRDGVKKGKSFLKSKALQLIFHHSAALWPVDQFNHFYITNETVRPVLLESELKPVFHPPKA